MLGLRTKGLPPILSVLVLPVLGISSMLAVACVGGQETNPVKLIPDGTNLIAQVNLTALLSTNGTLPLITAGMPGYEDGLSIKKISQEAMSEMGIDIRQFSQAVITVRSSSQVSSKEAKTLNEQGNLSISCSRLISKMQSH